MHEYLEAHVRAIILMAKRGHLTEENLRPYLKLIYEHGYEEGAAPGGSRVRAMIRRNRGRAVLLARRAARRGERRTRR